MQISSPRILIDSGPIVALFDRNDPYHATAVTFFRNARLRLLSTMACITEAMSLLDFSVRGQAGLLAWIKDRGVHLEELQLDDFERVIQLLQKYADRPMDFADAVTVTVCERLDISHIATFDRDFDIYRFKGRRHFVNVLKQDDGSFLQG